MSKQSVSQAFDFIKLRVASPLFERIGEARRRAASPLARLRQSVLSRKKVSETAQAETTPQSDFQAEFYKNFEPAAATGEARDERFGEFRRDELAGYYASPEDAPIDNEPEQAPQRADARPLFARLKGEASAAALNAGRVARTAAHAAAETLRAKVSNPRAAAAEFGRAAQLFGAAAARRIVEMRRMDAAVAGLFAMALLGPLAAPHLNDQATIALTRDNPLVARYGVSAERGLALSTPSTPTQWNGVPYAVAERDIAPEWVLNAGVDLGPLSPAEALSRQARVIEVSPAPIWSPALAALSVEDGQSDYESIQTANIPAAPKARPLNTREVANLELGAFDTGPTAAMAVAQGPNRVGDDRLASGHYATASAGVRAPETPWPTIGVDNNGRRLPSSVVEALSLGDASQQDLPLKSARIPSIRPVLVGAKRTPRLTVVLTAVGLNERASRAAIERLPSAVAMAIAPVAKDPSMWVDAARSTGRTALLEIPMEPVTYPRVDPGPLTLLASQDAEENLKRLNEALGKAPDVDGVASYLGSRFSSVRGAVTPVMAELKKRDLFLLETDPGPLSQLLRTAAEIDMSAVSSIVSLDKSGRSKDLTEGLARLEEAAKVKGHAIGVAVAVPSSVEALEAWMRDLEKRGFRLSALPL